MVSISPSSAICAANITLSPSSSFMHFTPPAPLPITGTVSVPKRMLIPPLLTMITVPAVSSCFSTAMTLSSSLRAMAAVFFVRRSNSFPSVRFALPRAVKNTSVSSFTSSKQATISSSFSSCTSELRFVALAVSLASGSSSTPIIRQLPWLVKNLSRLSVCVSIINTGFSEAMDSAVKLRLGRRRILPPSSSATMASSTTIMSSRDTTISSSPCISLVRRGTAYFSFMASISRRMTALSFSSDESMPLYSFISLPTSLYSFSMASLSRLVSLWSLRSSMA